MTRLLYLQASPRIERSHSIAVANAFVEAYQTRNPEHEVVTKNLFLSELEPFDGLRVIAKYRIMHGEEASLDEKQAWRSVEEVIEHFKSFDKYVLAVPMWNFSIPYRLKQYFDTLVQPGYTFTVDEKGHYRGLMPDRPVFIAYSRGGDYPQGSPSHSYDMQKPYLELILGFIGLTRLYSVVVEPTLAQGPEVAEQKRAAAIERARKMVAEF